MFSSNQQYSTYAGQAIFKSLGLRADSYLATIIQPLNYCTTSTLAYAVLSTEPSHRLPNPSHRTTAPITTFPSYSVALLIKIDIHIGNNTIAHLCIHEEQLGIPLLHLASNQ